jgi:hypothetical protein
MIVCGEKVHKMIGLNGHQASIFAALHLTKFLIFLHGCEQGAGGRRPPEARHHLDIPQWRAEKKLSLKKLPRRAENSKNMCLLFERTREGRFVHLPRGSRNQYCGSADHRPSQARKCFEDDRGDPEDRPDHPRSTFAPARGDGPRIGGSADPLGRWRKRPSRVLSNKSHMYFEFSAQRGNFLRESLFLALH